MQNSAPNSKKCSKGAQRNRERPMWDAVEFWKKVSEEKWETVSILKRLQKRSAFSVCLKYLLKPRPGFILTSSTIFDSLEKKIALHCPINTAKPQRYYQTKKTKSLSVRRKDHLHILWIFLLLWLISVWCWSCVKDLKCKDNQFLLADDISSLLRLTLTHHDNFLVSELACSAGVFFERAIYSRKCHVETSRREEEMGRVKGSGEGKGREKGKRRIFFLPSPAPPPFPSFAIAPTVRVTISTLPNLPLS